MSLGEGAVRKWDQEGKVREEGKNRAQQGRKTGFVSRRAKLGEGSGQKGDFGVMT